LNLWKVKVDVTHFSEYGLNLSELETIARNEENVLKEGIYFLPTVRHTPFTL
jgi:hypothetical protein